MNYNTQLCNTAWGEKLLARVTQCTCFCFKNRDSNFFRSVGKGVAMGSRLSRSQFRNFAALK